MTEPHKIRNIMQYTEVVYYDASGSELGREELNDVHTYDALPAEPLTEDEMEDWL